MSDDVESVIDFGSPFQTLRRIYLKNRKLAERADRLAEAGVWQFKQEAEPGTALPVGFPFLTQLQASGYTTADDLNGADAAELADWARLNSSQSKAIFAALAAL